MKKQNVNLNYLIDISFTFWYVSTRHRKSERGKPYWIAKSQFVIWSSSLIQIHGSTLMHNFIIHLKSKVKYIPFLVDMIIVWTESNELKKIPKKIKSKRYRPHLLLIERNSKQINNIINSFSEVLLLFLIGSNRPIHCMFVLSCL